MKNIEEIIRQIIESDGYTIEEVSIPQVYKVEELSAESEGSIASYEDSIKIVFTDGEYSVCKTESETTWTAGTAGGSSNITEAIIKNASIVIWRKRKSSPTGKETSTRYIIEVSPSRKEEIVSLIKKAEAEKAEAEKKERKAFFNKQLKEAMRVSGLSKKEILNIVNSPKKYGGYNFIAISQLPQAAVLAKRLEGITLADDLSTWREAEEKLGLSKREAGLILPAVNQILNSWQYLS